jgi:class 3 adenylate cyclase/tetratricopeptide (TPR) repeat protein
VSDSLATVASYVPLILVRELAARPAPLRSPVGRRFSGSVLFGDIVGFTSLTETLVRGGPEGIERLSRVLNGYFGRIVDLIREHGGEVISFSGDAPVALWSGADGELGALTRRAARCGLALQEELAGSAALPEGMSVSMRVGIGVGELLLATVGGVNGRWRFALLGEPLDQVAPATRRALPGQVVVSSQAWSQLRDCAAGDDLGDGCVRLERLHEPLPLRPLEAPPLPAEAEGPLRSFVPSSVLARIDAAQLGWLGDLRRVSVLFAALPHVDYRAPDAVEQLQPIVELLQTTVSRWGGSLKQISVDDKGSSCIAAWGLPEFSHDDDARRAVHAGVTIRDELRQRGLDCAVGIASGRAYCGDRGNESRREYALIGDCVNLAARLMAAAAGGILCDAPTREAVQSEASFHPLPPFKLKGKAELVDAFRVEQVGRERDRSPLPRLAGRAPEQAALDRHIEAVRIAQPGAAAAGRVVILEGEPGIGKSRLVSDLLERAGAAGMVALLGSGDAIEHATPYLAWRRIFSAALDLAGVPDDPRARRQHALDRLERDPELARLAPLVSAVLPINLPENDATRQMSGDIRAENTRDLLVRLLQGLLDGRPALIVLEDAHWLDSSSWALARLVSREVRPLLLVAATRPLPEPLPAEYTELLRAPSAQRLHLGGLAADDVEDLLRERLGVSGLSPELCRFVYERTEGHPFFSEELAYGLRDAGLLVIEEGTCSLASDARDPASLIPATIEGVVTTRIDNLTPRQQLALKVASVIGRAFSLPILREIHPVPDDREKLGDILAELERLDLIRLTEPDPEPWYAFTHVITRDVAYNLLLFEQRRQLHRDAAGFYERAFAPDLSPYFPLLAHHWLEAAHASDASAATCEKAIEYLERAGEQALHADSNQEAIRAFHLALVLADERPELGVTPLRRARWQRQLGEACYGLGQHARGREHLEAALRTLGTRVPSTPRQAAAALLREVGRQGLHRLGFAPRRRANGGRSHVWLETARCYDQLASIYHFAEEPILAGCAVFAALNCAERTGASPELARNYANVGGAIAGMGGMPRLGAPYFRRGRAVAQELGQASVQGYVSQIDHTAQTFIGRFDAAREAIAIACERFDHAGNLRRRDEALFALAIVSYHSGDFPRCAQAADELYASACRRGDAQAQVWGLISRAWLLLQSGQHDEAIGAVEAASALLRKELIPEQLSVHGLLARAWLRRGDHERAVERAARVAEMNRNTAQLSSGALEGIHAAAEVYTLLWERSLSEGSPDGPGRDALERRARAACKDLRKISRMMRIAAPRAWLWTGVCEHLSGADRKAFKAWQRSLDLAERYGMPYEQALAHERLGRHREPSDARRREHLARAVELLERLGASWDLARVRDELER